jgi:sialic acid synthase SpsE/spore coat polysaccharide biosynthesis protein SpsF (cytidylyltransferase family)
MKIGIVILCRYNSTRLPGKILKEIGGRTVLGHIVDRLLIGGQGYSIVVATSNEVSDEPIADYCRRANLKCFRGSLNDVAGRLLSCAEYYSWDYVVRINGDNLFTPSEILHSMLAVAETNIYDVITNVPGRSFPYGMSIEILKVPFFRNAYAEFNSQSDHEHVTSWLYANEDVGKRHVVINRSCTEAAGLKLALDTEEDFNRYVAIFERMDRVPAMYRLPKLIRLIIHSEQLTPWRGRYGPLLIAEIGGNHEGNFNVAKDLARKAIDTGVDYVKFQLYRGDSLVSPVESPDRNQHFKKFELSKEQHLAIANMCREAEVGYLASVWDLEMLEWIDPYLSVYKIGSGDLTAWPILRAFAKRCKPIILSTGLSTLDEVIQSVSQIQSVDNRYCLPEWLCLLQCTAMYPIAEKEANLQVLETLRQATGLAVGYSDHTEKGLALRTAAAMGAEVLEFHFTDTREGKVFRDHKVSLTPEEVKILQEDLVRIQVVKGSNIKIPQKTEIEQEHVTSFRRGIYLNKTVFKGQQVTSEDIVTLRPNHGLDARDVDLLPGAIVQNDLAAFKKLSWEDVEIMGKNSI